MGSGQLVRLVAAERERVAELALRQAQPGFDRAAVDLQNLDIGTTMGDGAQLGHRSSLYTGQVVPEGEHWHGSPGRRTETDFSEVDATPYRPWRRGLFAAYELVTVLGLGRIILSLAIILTVLAFPRVAALLESHPHAFTNWLFYDSVYTERYLKSPITNKHGYDTAAVHVNTRFAKTKYLLMQGSADDNVHFSNSAHMLDLLTKAKVRGFRFRMFTDSSHSVSTRGAYRELFEEMTAFLTESWGAGGKREDKNHLTGKKGRPALHNSVE